MVINGNLQNRRQHNFDRDEEFALRSVEEEQRRLDPVLRMLDDSIATYRNRRESFSLEPAVYDDDEPLHSISNLREIERQTSLEPDDDQEFEFKGLVIDPERTSDQAAANVRKLRITLHPKVEVVAATEASDNFTVLVHVKAPSASEDSKKQNYENCERNTVIDLGCRAPIDLVTVLDVSGSMTGMKLSLLKRAMAFVISNLSPADQLSIIVFSTMAKRVFPLKSIAPDGQHKARPVVDQLVCAGSTNIVEGLRIGTKVLEDRRQRNPVARIMLLLDGHDTYSVSPRGSVLFPIHEQRQSANVQVPVHAFGFGVEHDAAMMHNISKETGGTFSFIHTVGLIQDAFAQCIGGLLSVVVKDMSVTVSACAGTKLKSFHAGSYETCVVEDGSQGTVNLCDLFAEEERDILVELQLPASRDGTPVAPNLEVEKQRTCLRAAQAIVEAKTLADQGEMVDAQRVLQSAKIELQQIRTRYHPFSLALEAEITEIQARMTSTRTYKQSGRAFVVSAQSSHFRQRAMTRGQSFQNYNREYQTPSMTDMVMRSQSLLATTSANLSSHSTVSSSSGLVCAR
eukprot:PITA_32524